MARLYILNGPDTGRSYELLDGPTYLGRSSDNDIQIDDNTVSRRHLRIAKKGSRYVIMDLKSRSGTFYNGTYLASGIDHEVQQAVPIAIGMSVICIGGNLSEEIMPFLDTPELRRELGEGSGIFEVHREKTNQKKLELLYRVAATLAKHSPLNEALDEILDHIFELLGRIDRGAFILIDPHTEAITRVISKPDESSNDRPPIYCGDVVSRVLKDRSPVVISNAQSLKEEALADTLRVLNIESVICLPLMSSSHILGAMYFDSRRRLYGFSREDVLLFKELSRRIVDEVEKAYAASGQTV
jgi:pSer/pThr/pTyr-binding forkhead associated (FHA) protein